ncbi:hypothetical protein Syun_021669 [Stephania yunnanensis]|uniref:Uncharacterized protein n=1 Tax=Stephania yunnanensis TaxID=152371 RepID=A0AAP0IHZ0_9MAGN
MNAEIGEDGASRVGLVMSFDGEEKQWSCRKADAVDSNLWSSLLGRSPNRIDCSVDPLAKIRLIL